MPDNPAIQSIQDTIRLALYQSLNIDGEINAYTSMYDQHHINFIPRFTIDPTTETKTSYLQKRPGVGLIPSSNFMTGIVADPTQCTIWDAIAITALYDVFVIAVFDASNSTIYIIMARPNAASYVKIGSFAPTATVDDYCFLTEYTQSVAGSTVPAVAVSWTNKALTASKGYYAASSGGVFTLTSLTEITDTAFPPKQTPALISIGRFIPLNGTIYIASLDGRIWNSASTNNDISTWTDTTGQIGVISANAYPDQLWGIEKYKHNIVAFGRSSIQFFEDIGNNPCPLAELSQAFIKFGVKSPRVIKNINDVLYWVAYGNDGATGLWELQGYTPAKISNGLLDTMISYSTGDLCSINLQASLINNIPHLVLNTGNGVTTFPGFYYDTTNAYPTQADDSTSLDTYPLPKNSSNRLNEFSYATLCYNLVDKTWWGLQLLLNIAYYPICAGAEFGTPATQSNVNTYSNLVLYNIRGGGGTGTVTKYMYQWKINTLSTVSDEVGDTSGAYSAEQPIVSLVQLNRVWFQNEKRKRINKFKLIASVDQNRNEPLSHFTIYVYFQKDPNLAVDTQAAPGTPFIHNMFVRGMQFPTGAARYFLSNLGMGRVWQFCVVEKSKLPLRLYNVELDIQQGSH